MLINLGASDHVMPVVGLGLDEAVMPKLLCGVEALNMYINNREWIIDTLNAMRFFSHAKDILINEDEMVTLSKACRKTCVVWRTTGTRNIPVTGNVSEPSKADMHFICANAHWSVFKPT